MSNSLILIQEKYLSQIYHHALNIYPEECCGLLLGKIDNDFKQKTVMEIWETENIWQNSQENLFLFNHTVKHNISKKNRFSIASEILFKAQKYARDQEFAIIGIYHSHPDYPATPSEFDRLIAWSTYSYIIVSVTKEQVNQVKSWILDEIDQFQQEEILIVEIEKKQGKISF